MEENTPEVKIDTRRVIKVSKKKIKVTVVVLTVLILLFIGGFLFLRMSTRVSVNSLNMTGSNMMPTASESINYDYENGGYDMRIMNPMKPGLKGGYGQVDITDTREFLKTSFSATIKTRKVADVVQEVTNIIKGSDGRVDNSNSSEKYGRVSFVVPKSKFESFKDQIENIAHQKLYTENISSKNLLNQKQNIEEQTGNIVNTLANLQNQKANLLTKHDQALATINKELARLKTEITAVKTVINQTTDEAILVQLRIQENSLLKQETTQKQKLATENSTYTIQNQNLDNLINNSNNNLTNVNKQDDQFTNNIETVNGYVKVDWVNLWQMAKLFSPIHPTIVVIILVIILWIFSKRKGYIPRVEMQ